MRKDDVQIGGYLPCFFIYDPTRYISVIGTDEWMSGCVHDGFPVYGYIKEPVKYNHSREYLMISLFCNRIRGQKRSLFAGLYVDISKPISSQSQFAPPQGGDFFPTR